MNKITNEYIQDGFSQVVADHQPNVINDHGLCGAVIVEHEMSQWSMNCANITYTPVKSKAPNAFHRFMQGLFLGFKWTKGG